jgi:hypothetical protein
VTRLGLNEADQICVPRGSQIGALRMHRTDDDHQSGEGAYCCGERTSKRPATPVTPPLSIAGSA